MHPLDIPYYSNPSPEQWKEIGARPLPDRGDLYGLVAQVMEQVSQRGDEALREYTARFDGVELTSLVLSERQDPAPSIDQHLKAAIDQAYQNIAAFHRTQLIREEVVETMPGIRCWREMRPIGTVGLYIPGGSAPLFSTVLMLAIPAQLAGCKNIVLCTPPSTDGTVHPAMRYAAGLAGITDIYRVGGAQAIAAMTFGTETVPRVDKIFGPGNHYVTEAKMQALHHGVAIDMPAGPSEVLVIADSTADPAHVAADMISQAEHGSDSQTILLSTDTKLAHEVQAHLSAQLAALPRGELASVSIAKSRIIHFPSLDDAIAFSNQYAPEHLILNVAQAPRLVPRITDAGSVFLGPHSPEAVGDYASGTNHTLPTNGWARSYSGVSIDSFVKKITFQQLSAEGLKSIASTVEQMAMAESLAGHARAVSIRLKS